MDEYNKLLRKVKELEAENFELKERLKWRDARKELPPSRTLYALESNVVEICISMINSKKRVALGFYDHEAHKWRVTMSPFDKEIIYWRPLDLPEELQ